MEFLLGAITAACLLSAGYGIVILRQLQGKRQILNDELATMLRAVSESHNKLTQNVTSLDQKVSETKLRLDNYLAESKIRNVSRFGQ